MKGKNSLNLYSGHFPDKSTIDEYGQIEDNLIYQINASEIDTFLSNFLAALFQENVNKSLSM